jgi:hypothetical protein
MSPSYDDLRSDLAALAVADPAALGEIVITCIKKHPTLDGLVRRLVHGSVKTRSDRATATTEVGPASPATVAAVCQQYTATTAPTDITHTPPLVWEGHVVNLSVKKGSPAIILGGNVANLDGIASLVEAKGGDPAAALSSLSDAIAEQLGGKLSRHTMTRRGAPSLRAPRPLGSGAQEGQLEEERARQCGGVIAAFWMPAASLRRERGESALNHAQRLARSLRTQAATGDERAQDALDRVCAEYADVIGSADVDLST